MPIRFFLSSVMQTNKRQRLGFIPRNINASILGRTGAYKNHWYEK